jgi:hypothetical protein
VERSQWFALVAAPLEFLGVGITEKFVEVHSSGVAPIHELWPISQELLGAFGLVLPGFLRIRPGLTPLAAGAEEVS